MKPCSGINGSAEESIVVSTSLNGPGGGGWLYEWYEEDCDVLRRVSGLDDMGRRRKRRNGVDMADKFLRLLILE